MAPPVGQTRAVWDFNQNTQADALSERPLLQAASFKTVFGACQWTTWLAALVANGMQAWATDGNWIDGNPGSFNTSNAQAVIDAQAAAAVGGVQYFFIADEPTPSAANATLVGDRAAAIKAATGIPTMISYFDINTISTFAGTVDVMALDIYPMQFGVVDMTLITNTAAAADAAGVSYYGVPWAFTDGTSHYPRLPTVSELQTEFDTWRATKQLGWAIYAWGATSGVPANNLENHPDLLSVIAAN